MNTCHLAENRGTSRRSGPGALCLWLAALVLLLTAACADNRAPSPTPTATPVPAATAPAHDPTVTPTLAATPPPAPETSDIPAKLTAPKDTSESTRQSGGTGGDEQALPIPDKTGLRYPNLGSRLDGLVAGVEAGQAMAEEAAKDAAIHRGASIAVTIHLYGSVDDVVAFLEGNGGDPRNVGEDYIEAYVPVSLLGPVSNRPGVIRVREIVPPQPGWGG